MGVYFHLTWRVECGHTVDEEPLGVIVLAGCSVDSGDRVPELGLFTFIIKFEASSQPTRTFELAAESGSFFCAWFGLVCFQLVFEASISRPLSHTHKRTHIECRERAV